MYRIALSAADASLSVSELADTAIRIRNAFGYSNQDARTVALTNINFISRASQMTLNLVDSWAKGDDTVKQLIPRLLGLTKVNNEGVQFAGDSLEKTSRLSLILLVQFQIEAFLKNMHLNLQLGRPPNGFYRTAVAVLAALVLPANNIDILNTPARIRTRIRNSLHGNGIHSRQHPNEPVLVNVGGVAYEFRDGQRVTCAGWPHVAHSLEQSLSRTGFAGDRIV